MVGNQQHPVQTKDFNDPFQAGQMVGMLVMATFLERNKNITPDALEHLKWACAQNATQYLDKPAEDIFLMINGIVKEIEDMK